MRKHSPMPDAPCRRESALIGDLQRDPRRLVSRVVSTNTDPVAGSVDETASSTLFGGTSERLGNPSDEGVVVVTVAGLSAGGPVHKTLGS